ncbi:MAG: hypothetical protein ACPLRN_03545 [Microgenomates group bacterium]
MERWRQKNKETQQTSLTPHQIKQALSFGKEHLFSTDLITPQEQQVIKEFSQSLTDTPTPLFISNHNLFEALIQLTKNQPNPDIKKIFERISDYVSLYAITAQDLESEKSFSKLPFEAKLVISTCGRGIFSQLKQFLENGGILTVLFFRKPSPNYLEAISEESDHSSLSPLEKVHRALTSPSENIKQASHQFISIEFTPPQPDNQEMLQQASHLTKIISPRVNKIEEELAKIKLLEALMNEEMKEVFISLGSLGFSVPFFYVLNHLGENNQLAQATIKILSHFTSNLINAYAQFKLWLKGDNSIEEIKDFLSKIIKNPLILSMMTAGMGIDALSEMIGKNSPLAGSAIFGGEAVFGSVITTLASLRQNSHQHSFLQELKENPAALAMNLAALGTMAASIGVLGLADQFHNPLAVAVIGQATEPLLAALFTKLIIGNASREFREEMEEKIKKWTERNINKN